MQETPKFRPSPRLNSNCDPILITSKKHHWHFTVRFLNHVQSCWIWRSSQQQASIKTLEDKPAFACALPSAAWYQWPNQQPPTPSLHTMSCPPATTPGHDELNTRMRGGCYANPLQTRESPPTFPVFIETYSRVNSREMDNYSSVVRLRGNRKWAYIPVVPGKIAGVPGLTSPNMAYWIHKPSNVVHPHNSYPLQQQ